MRKRITARFGDRPHAQPEEAEQYSAKAVRVVHGTPTMEEYPCADAMTLMEAMVEPENMRRALLRVERNKDAAGID